MFMVGFIRKMLRVGLVVWAFYIAFIIITDVTPYLDGALEFFYVPILFAWVLIGSPALLGCLIDRWLRIRFVESDDSRI